MNIRFFHPDIEKFIHTLPNQAYAKTMHTLELLEKFGYLLRMPHSKYVLPRLFELRISGQLPVRLFYTFHQKTALLLHGFLKKSQKAPQQEIAIAQQRIKELDQI